jgi:hypothetical protein
MSDQNQRALDGVRRMLRDAIDGMKRLDTYAVAAQVIRLCDVVEQLATPAPAVPAPTLVKPAHNPEGEVIRDEFKVHILNEDGIARASSLAEEFSRTLNAVETISGTDGREMALVRTHLQLASFYAKRAMASRPENQREVPIELTQRRED